MACGTLGGVCSAPGASPKIAHARALYGGFAFRKASGAPFLGYRWLEKRKRTYDIGTRFSEVGKPIDRFWEAYWTENGRDVSRRFSENAYGEGIVERKAREARLAAEERLPNLRRSR
jgi:hypothetical protein